MNAAYIRGVKAGVPIFALALAFGVLARSLGWGTTAPIVMSFLVFSGSAQFAVAAVLGTGGTALAAIAAAVLVNARFLPMGMAVAQSLRGGPLRRAIEGQTVVDAGWAFANRGHGHFDRELLIGFAALMYASWITGTIVGALAGPALGDLHRFGIDAVLPAFFLALLADELTDDRARRAAATATAIAATLLLIAPTGLAVPGASAAALLGLRAR